MMLKNTEKYGPGRRWCQRTRKNTDKDEDDVKEHGKIRTRTKMMLKNTEKYGPGRRWYKRTRKGAMKNEQCRGTYMYVLLLSTIKVGSTITIVKLLMQIMSFYLDW
jgi:hypothetical protein